MTKMMKIAAVVGVTMGGLALSGCAHQKENMQAMQASQASAERAAAEAKQAAAEAKAAADEAKAAAETANRSYGRTLRK